ARPSATLGRPDDLSGGRRLPVIDASRCLGCRACVDACPYDVFAIERYVATVAHPDACCGLTLCERACPNGSLVVTELDDVARDAPLVQASLEAMHAPGVFLAGDVTGLPLIKNAIVQGRRAVDSVRDSLAAAPAAARAYPLDVLVVGAGPAGISAALRCQELGLRYRVLEQASVAQSIRSFPRGKLVFDQPLELPLAGKLWLEESTKEELLAKWLRIVRTEALAVDEGVRFVGLEREPEGGFSIEATEADGAPLELRAARVLVAVGMRGTPRRLGCPVPAEAESRVHYHLADARSFAEARVLVVGLGDAAMEAAIALARQPGCRVTVCHRGPGFGRGKRRNVEELGRLVAAGRVTVLWRSEVAALRAGAVELAGPDGRQELATDAVLVLIGSIPPLELLRRAGVCPERA
ncbi:MAG: NAD(P)-binding domain-containing protein, partial [Myxococcales bacterium]|nr:NAD(P)-binding domain-containing protein [Myxococcales bacterium]